MQNSGASCKATRRHGYTVVVVSIMVWCGTVCAVLENGGGSTFALRYRIARLNKRGIGAASPSMSVVVDFQNLVSSGG